MYVISQPTPVANTFINKSSFTGERTIKNTLFANSIPIKCLKFALRCFESGLTQSIKCTCRELSSVLGLLQKISWCANGGNKQHLFQQFDFHFSVYKSVTKTNPKEQALLMDQDRGKYSIDFF